MKNAQKQGFDEAHVLHELRHFLPSQGPLKDFIHHNSLHAFQEKTFFEGVFKAAKIFGFRPTLSLGEFRAMAKTGRIRLEILEKIIVERKGRAELSNWLFRTNSRRYETPAEPRVGQLRKGWKSRLGIDLDDRTQPVFFRLLATFLDQGIAVEHFPFEEKGLIEAIKRLEKDSFFSFFQSKRAKKLLFDPELSIQKLLEIVVGDARFFEQYLFDQAFAHRGWSGLVAALEAEPKGLLYEKKVGLRDAILLDLLLEIDALDREFGEAKWPKASENGLAEPLDLFVDAPISELEEVLTIWQEAFEWSYYDEVFAGVKQAKKAKTAVAETANPHSAIRNPHSFQAIFCIDEREDSLRRHIESIDPACETLGCPGFFGVEFYFQPIGGKFLEKLCPAPVTPKFLIKEVGKGAPHGHEFFHSKRTHGFALGFLASLSMGLLAAGKLFLTLFRPKMSPAISDAYAHMSLEGELLIENKSLDDRENDLQLGFTVGEMAARVEGLLRGIGLVENFAPIVYVVAHGSSSANNPHHGAHDCGACSGRPGATNSRVFAFMANHAEVRAILAKNGLIIPDSTRFLGAMHDTAADEIGYYDVQILQNGLAEKHILNVAAFENALDLNAKERSRRFASIDTKADLKAIREAIRRRSVSMFEPRPELGHGTNALCFVGKRDLTKGLFLDRRAFMNSYDWATDPDGAFLLGVMRPLPPVCGGINLEYYFSRVDNQKMGAGTKLPHNVVGLIAVQNSTDGDVRPGLPWQMIEVHDPVRLMIVVEHRPEVVLKTILREPSLYDWFEKGWVKLAAIDPTTDQFSVFKNGKFEAYEPLLGRVGSVGDVQNFIEKAREMETNAIVHATAENLPVHVLN